MSDAGSPGFREILSIRDIRAAMVGTFVIMLGFGVLSPVLPRYARSFGVGYDAVGVLIASFSLTRLVLDPFPGRIVGRFGERPVVTVGAVVVGASSALAAFAPSFPLLVLFRAAGGAGSAVFFAGLLSYLLRTVPKDRVGRVMSVYYGSFNVGIIAGQPFGGLFAKWFGLASPLLIYALACVVSAAVFWRTIGTPMQAEGEVRHQRLRSLPWDRPFLTVLAVNGAYMWMVGAVYSTLVPLFGNERVGLSLSGVGIGLAISSATEFAVLFPAGKATDRSGRRAVLVPAFVGMVVVVALMGLAWSTLLYMASLGALGVVSGYAGVPPAAMLSDLSSEGTRGAAVGAFRFVGDIGFVLGPLCAGWTAAHLSFGSAFAINAIPSAVALGMLLSIRETMPALPRTGEAPGL